MEPIACSLSRTDYAVRLASLSELPLISRAPIEGGAVLSFEPRAEAAVRAAIAAEADCCPFLEFDLDVSDGSVRVEVSGPPDAQPIIAELFA